MTGETVLEAVLLGIDAGGSSTKWASFGVDGEVVRRGRAGALTGHLFSGDDEVAMRAVLRQISENAGVRPVAVVAGVSGLQVHAAPKLRQALCETFTLDAGQIRLSDDLELAYAAHFVPGEGVLVYAGTGSVAYHQTRSGEVLRAGGHGFLLGDEGGAFWQGQQGLKAVLNAQDAGQTPSGPLISELEAVIGGLDWPQVRAWVYGGGRGAVATLAPAVERAALAGDRAALDVTWRAGLALAGLALTLQHRLSSPLPLVLAGGAANALVRAAFLQTLHEKRPGTAVLPARDPLLGAVRLTPSTISGVPES